MFIEIVWFIVGLTLILLGADWLTDGASALGKRAGMSDLAIGISVVAFGTSAPELFISSISALTGNTGLAIGNVVGSNIFNICVIIGVVALIRPLKVEGAVLKNDIPYVIISSLALLTLGMNIWFGGNKNMISRTDGILFLLFLSIYLRYAFASATRDEDSALDNGEVGENKTRVKLSKTIILIILGLTALVLGGDRFVNSAEKIAIWIGVDETTVGLTIVAMGTSLPELATSIVAALKGNADMAIGNVIGSNILNVFFVLGIAAVITPIPFSGIGVFDLTVLLLSSGLFWLFGWKFKEKTITRFEGAILLAVYIAYTIYLIVLPKI